MKRPRQFNMLVSSLIMGVSFAFLLGSIDQSPVPSHLSLRAFPDELSGWSGTPVPMSKKEQEILNADDFASILFTKNATESSIFFFSAFYQHQTPEKNIHSPKNCLPGSGWAMIDTRVISVPLENGGKPQKINQVVIQKGLSKQVVLYWYQERGRIFPNEYWGRFYLVKDALTLHRTDGALVRISASLEGSVENTVDRELRFVRDLTPMLSEYIPGRHNVALPSSPGTSMNSFQKNLNVSETGHIRGAVQNG